MCNFVNYENKEECSIHGVSKLEYAQAQFKLENKMYTGLLYVYEISNKKGVLLPYFCTDEPSLMEITC